MENAMIERVAKAIRDSGIGVDMPGSPHRFVNVDDAARAAIEAMREPTDRMVDHARAMGPVVLMEREVGRPYARTLIAEEVRAVHAAMIDAALSPGEQDT